MSEKFCWSGLCAWKEKVVYCTQGLENVLETERDRWIFWIPVALGLGIAFYFCLHHEPPWLLFFGIGLPLLGVSGILLFWNPLAQFIGWAVLWMVVGFGLILGRTTCLQHPPWVLPPGPLWVTGCIESVDHPASKDRLFQRIILVIHESVKKRLPTKARITIRTSCPALYEGDFLKMKVVLMPLPGPCFPGAHDPRRQSFFDGVGANGFALTSPVRRASKPSLLGYWRHSLTRKIHERLPPPLGAVACGLVTGDKIALPELVRQSFSDSGLSHLLAIAGLHVSIVSGLCFFLFRRGLARIPYVALYTNLDGWAACFSLSIGWVYLMISGQRCPAQRAFCMMAAAMVAMILGRKRHSMRILMLCAAAFLILSPQSLLTLSYQLSFSAVAGLLSFYEARRTEWKLSPRRRPLWLRRLWRFIQNSLYSTGVITLTTAPIMAFHFCHISLQGFLSNLVAIPFTAMVVMPMGGFALLSLATPWSDPIFSLWACSLQGLVSIAHSSAAYGTSLILHVPPHSSFWFAWTMISVFWLLLWKQTWRWWGAGAWILCSFLGYRTRIIPSLLVDGHHGLLGWLDHAANPPTLWVSSLRKGKYITKRWAQSYGLHKIAKLPEVSLWWAEGKRVGITLSQRLPSGLIDILVCAQRIPGSNPSNLLLILEEVPYTALWSGKKLLSSQEYRPWAKGWILPEK